MPNFATITVFGHLGQDPETRTTSGGAAVTNASIAYTPYGEGKETIWFSVSVWGKQGEAFAKFFKKGSAALVTGELGQESWERDGVKKSKMTIRVNQFSGVGKPTEGGEEEQPRRAPRAAPKKSSEPDYGDIPF